MLWVTNDQNDVDVDHLMMDETMTVDVVVMNEENNLKSTIEMIILESVITNPFNCNDRSRDDDRIVVG